MPFSATPASTADSIGFLLDETSTQLTVPSGSTSFFSDEHQVAKPLGLDFRLWLGAARQFHPRRLAVLRPAVKFLARALIEPKLTTTWLARLHQPDVLGLSMVRPRLFTKLQRPYVSSVWSPATRCAALLGHYDALVQVLGPAGRMAIYRDSLPLLQLLNLSGTRRTSVTLTYRDQFEKEGELTLALNDVESGLMLAGITFCMPLKAGQRKMVIGGLQASPDPLTRTLIHDFAKDCHGMRPKALALWCLQELAAIWQVEQIQAIDDSHHIYRHSHKRRSFAASYDEFWAESDGQPLVGGGWELPLRLRERSRQELKPNRRKAHELRYAMLGRISPIFRARLRTLAPGGPHAESLPLPPNGVYAGEPLAPKALQVHSKELLVFRAA